MPVRVRSAYKESLPLFVSILSTQIYVNVNRVVIGSFLGMLEVSIYDMADKVLLLMFLFTRLSIILSEQVLIYGFMMTILYVRMMISWLEALPMKKGTYYCG